MKNLFFINHVKRFTRVVEKGIITLLILMMSLILLYATWHLGVFLFNAIFTQDSSFTLDKIMDLFGGFLLVLIGIELLDTIKVYLKDNVIHVEVVILVAIIALARKVIILKVEDYTGLVIIGIGVLILALTGSYFLIRKAGLMTIMLDNDPEVELPDSYGFPDSITTDIATNESTHTNTNTKTKTHTDENTSGNTPEK